MFYIEDGNIRDPELNGSKNFQSLEPSLNFSVTVI